MKVYLVRHAESEANAGNKTADPATIPITAKGRNQAIELVTKFDVAPDLIVVTPFLRTSQTSLPLADKFTLVKVETWPLHEFTYLSPETCKDTTPLERLPLVNDYWNKLDPEFIHGLGAESFSQFSERIIGSIEKLRKLDHQSVVVFTHGQVMTFLKQYFSGSERPQLKVAMKNLRDEISVDPFENTAIFEM